MEQQFLHLAGFGINKARRIACFRANRFLYLTSSSLSRFEMYYFMKSISLLGFPKLRNVNDVRPGKFSALFLL